MKSAALVPGRRHFVATEKNWPELRRELRKYRIGLAPVMLTRESNALRRAAYRLAPRKILAYNSRLERHHLRLDLASFLFWRGVPLDRIYLRPWWWPWPKRERSVTPERLSRAGRPRLLAGTPPRGGALALFSVPARRTAARCASSICCARWRASSTWSFSPSPMPMKSRKPRRCWSFARASCWWRSRATASRAGPRWRRPKCTSFVHPPCARPSPKSAARSAFELLQVEYTHLAEYGGDILVEHDVTFDLFGQIARRERTLAAWWDFFRWRRFETRAMCADTAAWW